MINLQWAIAEDNQWYTLEGHNFSSITAKGVYVIWHEGRPGRYVRVGQGAIGERLTAHRHDPAILAFNKSGILRVTWALVHTVHRNAAERYLALTLQPLLGYRFPDLDHVRVNLPGAA